MQPRPPVCCFLFFPLGGGCPSKGCQVVFFPWHPKTRPPRVTTGLRLSGGASPPLRRRFWLASRRLRLRVWRSLGGRGHLPRNGVLQRRGRALAKSSGPTWPRRPGLFDPRCVLGPISQRENRGRKTGRWLETQGPRWPTRSIFRWPRPLLVGGVC